MLSRNILLTGTLLYGAAFALLLPTRLADPLDLTFSSDAAEYNAGAVHLATSGMYSLDGVLPYIEREPGMSAFLAVVYFFFGIENRLAVFVVQGMLYLISVLLFISAFQKISSRRVTLLCLFLLLTLPAAFHAMFSPIRESLALSLALLFATATLSLAERPSASSAVATGGALGALILTYMPFLFLPFALLPLLRIGKMQLRNIVLLLLSAFLPVVLWGVRNTLHTGQPSLSGVHRPAVAWYVRGEQAEKVRGLEPFRCLYAEYISRDWTDRSPACSFNALMHEKWPGGIFDAEEDIRIGAEGRAKILAHLPQYLWFSLFEILELHLPYVNGWGKFYNILASLSMVLLYLGCMFALPTIIREWRKHLLFLIIPLYSTTVFALTDATPRYLMPVIFCYAVLASLGYDRLLIYLRPP